MPGHLCRRLIWPALLAVGWLALCAASVAQSPDSAAPLINLTDSACLDCDAFDESLPADAEEPWLVEDAGGGYYEPLWRPFDFFRDLGFRHSSTHGRYTGRGIPRERSSWLNRPYHVDWFLGPLLGDDPAPGRVGQANELFGGLRIGWDFDYYWGIQWRIGWSDPDLETSNTGNPLSGNYLISDVDLVYYPWGDTKIRPYFTWGLGLNEIGSLHPDGQGHEATLLAMPFGGGIEFPQTPWLAWRLEVVDNLAFGSDGIATMHNVSLTAGMEFRLGARPRSYWPWRSSRRVW